MKETEYRVTVANRSYWSLYHVVHVHDAWEALCCAINVANVNADPDCDGAAGAYSGVINDVEMIEPTDDRYIGQQDAQVELIESGGNG